MNNGIILVFLIASAIQNIQNISLILNGIEDTKLEVKHAMQVGMLKEGKAKAYIGKSMRWKGKQTNIL